GSGDGFLVKFNSSGVRQWGTYYGGSNADGGLNCAVDAASNVYLTGFTMSSGMATSGAHQTSSGGIIDHYLAKFTSSGSRVWSTYYGGSNLDEFTDIAVQDSSYIFLSGQTQSSNNIATTGSHQSALASGGTIPDAFLVKFNTAGVRQWGTYYGGSNYESGLGVAVDHNGNSYLCGWTRSSGMATSGAFKTSYSGNDDGFLVKFNSSGVRQWATYYGGTAFDWNYDMDVDQLGDIYIIGGTTSASGISVAGTYQNSLAGLGDWFLVKMNSSGQRTYSTYFGGIMGETPSKVAVTSNLKIVLSGKTATSTGLATTGAHQSSNGGMSDGLIVMFSQCANGSELVTSACSSYTSPSGLHTWTSSGIYTDVFTNAQGCDSIITINLTILNNDTTLDVTACVNYKSANGNIYTSSGTYIDTIMNSFGCDSIITVDLTIVSVDDSLFVSNNVITANATSASFQWIDCNTMTTLQGETGNSLTVIQNGSYAVIVNQSGCSDTSECIDVNWIGLEEYNNQEFRIYPVPTNDQIIIECKKSLAPFRVDIIGPLGEVVLTYDNLISSINRLDVSGLPGAVYTLRIEHNGIVGHKRFIKE
ncbi:MAG TPA: hypothetical protein DCX54_04585, partial [Flavobacteriales bacterium]|nr:hypothetical protein [Flavobacteriales bacterium]